MVLVEYHCELFKVELHDVLPHLTVAADSLNRLRAVVWKLHSTVEWVLQGQQVMQLFLESWIQMLDHL